jgi:hypothetical protein
MSVSISPTDYTWHHHVDGFLALLHHQQDATASPIFSHLATALKFLDTSLQAVTSPTQLLTISLLRLRSSVRELRVLTADKPRQIELLKYRVALKKLYADIRLLSSSFSDSVVDDLTCRALVIVAGKVLVRTGELVTSRPFGATRSAAKLLPVVHDAGVGIYNAAMQYCESDTATSGTSAMGMVRMMWPLCAAHIAVIGCREEERRSVGIQELLSRLGNMARMPVALALVSLRCFFLECKLFVYLDMIG